MDRHANGLPDLSIERRLGFDAVFVAVWLGWAALTVGEFEAITPLVFLGWSLIGAAVGVVVIYWLRRTRRGRSIGRRWREISIEQQLHVAFVPVVAVVALLIGALVWLNRSTNLGLVMFFGGLLARRLTDTVLLYARSR